MSDDIFGNFWDWGSVIKIIAELRERREMDAHQEGLTRILRYRGNWRLRETALDCVKDVTHPSDDLLQAVLAIMMDENIYCGARVMAAEALADVFSRCPGENKQIGANVTVELIVEKLKQALRQSGPPVFQNALRRQLDHLEQPVSSTVLRPTNATHKMEAVSQ